MLEKLRQHLTYANVTATLALFIALGGSSYAALRVGSREIADNSIRSRDVNNHSLTRHDLARNTLDGSVIRESRLGRVPRAAVADDADASAAWPPPISRLKCPSDTLHDRRPLRRTSAATALWRTARPALTVLNCWGATLPGSGAGFPTHGELRAALQGLTLAPGGELTGDVWPDTSGELQVLFVTTQGGSVGVTSDTDAGKKAFRCVFDPRTEPHARRRNMTAAARHHGGRRCATEAVCRRARLLAQRSVANPLSRQPSRRQRSRDDRVPSQRPIRARPRSDGPPGIDWTEAVPDCPACWRARLAG